VQKPPDRRRRIRSVHSSSLLFAKILFGEGKGADGETAVCRPGKKSRLEIKM